MNYFFTILFQNLSSEMFNFKLKEEIVDSKDVFNMSIFFNLVMETEAFATMLSKKMCECLLFMLIKITDNLGKKENKENKLDITYENKVIIILYKL